MSITLSPLAANFQSHSGGISTAPELQTDPFSAFFANETRYISLLKRLPDYEHDFEVARHEVAYPKPEGFFPNDSYQQKNFRLTIAKYMLEYPQVIFTRQKIAGLFEEYSDELLAPFVQAPIVKLQADLAIVSNGFDTTYTKDLHTALTNQYLASAYTALRARIMGVRNRQPRVIIYAEKACEISGTLLPAIVTY